MAWLEGHTFVEWRSNSRRKQLINNRFIDSSSRGLLEAPLQAVAAVPMASRSPLPWLLPALSHAEPDTRCAHKHTIHIAER
jgi:hypothetical protein